MRLEPGPLSPLLAGDSVAEKSEGHPARMAFWCGRERVGWTESEGLFEGRNGAGFVVVDVEDGIELGELQDVLHLFGEA